MKECSCGKNNYKWSVDDFSQSWLKCANCEDNFFEDDIGVILINWRVTDINHITVEDVLKSNAHEDGVVTRNAL